MRVGWAWWDTSDDGLWGHQGAHRAKSGGACRGIMQACGPVACACARMWGWVGTLAPWHPGTQAPGAAGQLVEHLPRVPVLDLDGLDMSSGKSPPCSKALCSALGYCSVAIRYVAVPCEPVLIEWVWACEGESSHSHRSTRATTYIHTEGKGGGGHGGGSTCQPAGLPGRTCLPRVGRVESWNTNEGVSC